MDNQFFIVKPDVIFTSGQLRGLIVDLSAGKFSLVPLSLISFFERRKIISLSALSEKYSPEDIITIQEYIEWLIKEEYGLLFSDLSLAKQVNRKTWKIENPFSIRDCIIEADQMLIDNFEYIIHQLDKVRVPDLELRFFLNIRLDDMYNFLCKVQESDINSVTVIARYNKEMSVSKIKKKFAGLTVISEMVLFGANDNKEEYIQDKTTRIKYLAKDLSNLSCGTVDIRYFFPNKEFYQESRIYNSCLSKKLSISMNGDIKNCPSSVSVFGNIYKDNLNDIICKSSFQSVWAIAKKNISVCSGCEFRDVCQDCRAYLQTPDDPYSKPLKCGYDPFTGKWEDWSKNQLNAKAIEFYGFKMDSK